MGGVAPQSLPLDQSSGHQSDLSLSEIAEAAVYQLGRPGGGALGEVIPLHKSHSQPPRGRVESGTDTGDAAPDHANIEVALFQPGKSFRSAKGSCAHNLTGVSRACGLSISILNLGS